MNATGPIVRALLWEHRAASVLRLQSIAARWLQTNYKSAHKGARYLRRLTAELARSRPSGRFFMAVIAVFLRVICRVTARGGVCRVFFSALLCNYVDGRTGVMVVSGTAA